MSEEVDYMSDEFITSCIANNGDVRPGLLKTHTQQRQHDLMKKKINASQQKKPSPEVLQAEVLEEGLRQPIASTNKGFSMLQKMGFKTGMGLGKDNKGMVEPISINIKNDKKGLGHKVKLNKVSKEKKEELNKISKEEYRTFLSNKNKEREILSDLRKSQRMCRELDLKAEKNKPEEVWFWPDDKEEKEAEESESDSDEDEIDLSNLEKLEMLTRYLRETYYYCVWCKVQYCDEKDLQDCPGVTRDDH